MFGGAAQAFTPAATGKPRDSDPAGSEIAKLKAKLAALQAKVDKLG